MIEKIDRAIVLLFEMMLMKKMPDRFSENVPPEQLWQYHLICWLVTLLLCALSYYAVKWLLFGVAGRIFLQFKLPWGKKLFKSRVFRFIPMAAPVLVMHAMAEFVLVGQPESIELVREISRKLIAVFLTIGLGYLAYFLTRYVLFELVHRFIERTDIKWDDLLVANRVFRRIAMLTPAIVVYHMAPVIFPETSAAMATLAHLLQIGAMVFLIVTAMLTLDALINAMAQYFDLQPATRDFPVRGTAQATKIALYFFGVIFILSTLLQRSPWKLLAGLGALTAVLILVFKDPILGFVASLQLSTNDMVRVGDWIAMPQFGADGDVIEISIVTVKVRNWDKTIVNVPTYALVSGAFKNWRGMQQTGGRRIMRAIYIDMSSIRHCTREMLERYKKIRYIQDYIDRKIEELARWNKEHQVEETDLINARKLTNVGTFRAYCEAFLQHHPRLRQDLTFMVRQLQPTPHGLPIEIYVFAATTEWTVYEKIQADVFDHLLSIVPEFDLTLYQQPSGKDVLSLREIVKAPPDRMA